MVSDKGGELLNLLVPLLKVRPVIDDFCRFGGGWESPHAPGEGDTAHFHIVTRGACRIDRAGHPALVLEAGDILLLPHGDSHIVRSRTRGARRPITADYRNGIRSRTTAGADADTELLCGQLHFEARRDSPLLALLPNFILIRTADEPLLERYRRILIDISEELDSGKIGSEAIAADLARALFVMMLRDHLTGGSYDGAIFSLLNNPITARAVLAMLNDPAQNWTLDALAEIGGTSRASLVRSFRKLAQIAPIAFLAEIRLMIARQRLVGTSDSIAQIAADVGYQSESALSRAMMRKLGYRPGSLRLARDEVPVAKPVIRQREEIEDEAVPQP